VCWLLNKECKTHKLTVEQTDLLQAWLEATPALRAGRDIAQHFTDILAKPQIYDSANDLKAWITDALASPVSCIKQFAKGILADYDAVLAALQLPWSNAQLEGQVNRLKLIKCQMYGRAKFDLLKIRVMTKV
jgi:transposase